MPELSRDEEVFILDLGEGENRLNPDFVAAVNAALDEVEAAGAPRALVTRARGKIWSNGLDLEWLMANQDRVEELLADVHGLLARLLEFPVPTVAALQGHTFAGGAMVALAHDFRVMRSDRGFFCLPEVDIRIPFTPGMAALIQARLTPKAALDAMTTGRRYGAPEALSAQIVDAVAEEDKVLEAALDLARPLAGKDPATLGAIKQRMFAGTLAALRDPSANRAGDALG